MAIVSDDRTGNATLATDKETLSRHPRNEDTTDVPNPTTTIKHGENQDHRPTVTVAPSAGIGRTTECIRVAGDVDVAIDAGNGVASTNLGSRENASTSDNGSNTSGVSKASCGANGVCGGTRTEVTAENGADMATSCGATVSGTTSGLEDGLKTDAQAS